jgi:hypothetical protein
LPGYAHRRSDRLGLADHVISQTVGLARHNLDEVPDSDEAFPWLPRVTRTRLACGRRTSRALSQHPAGAALGDPACGEFSSSGDEAATVSAGRLVARPAGICIAALGLVTVSVAVGSACAGRAHPARTDAGTMLARRDEGPAAVVGRFEVVDGGDRGSRLPAVVGVESNRLLRKFQ